MTAYQKLYTGIGRAAWGYFFIYFDFNINTVSILPSFIGYMLFLSAINCLCEEERELNLLRTLGVILTVWHVASWLASWGSIDLDGMLQVVDIIIGVVNIYFHFQLLTNLASIATKYQSADDELDAKLLRYRTLQTVTGKTEWNQRTVRDLITNEKYVGDLLLQKSYIEDTISKKTRKNFLCLKI